MFNVIKLTSFASNTGNVRIGIIGFSSLKNTNKGILPIQKLTTENYHNMLNFIDNLTMDNGTALYYAIDKSVNALDQYSKGNIVMDQQGAFVNLLASKGIETFFG